jgi:hypothetical protein
MVSCYSRWAILEAERRILRGPHRLVERRQPVVVSQFGASSGKR